MCVKAIKELRPIGLMRVGLEAREKLRTHQVNAEANR